MQTIFWGRYPLNNVFEEAFYEKIGAFAGTD